MASYTFEVVFFGGSILVSLLIFLTKFWLTRRFDRRWGKEPPRGDR